MKKKYIRPESRLLLINLAENIASSEISGGGSGGGEGNDIISSGQNIIEINPDGQGGWCYAHDQTAPVKNLNNTYAGYYAELLGYLLSNPVAYAVTFSQCHRVAG